MTLQERVEELEQLRPKLRQAMISAAKNATIRAVERASELTPPTAGDLAGTNTRSGEMKQHWDADSKTEPEVSGESIKTHLNNNKEYASYVNDGHRMDRHFVPGLYVNPSSGLLEYDPSADVGIVVGTKTSYVPGIFMTEKAKEEYRRVVREELKDLEELLK